MRVTDLFCGAGLFSAGFSAADFEIVQAVELDREAVKSYSRNVSPNVVQGSVTAHKPVETDVLIAGPPCQGFSTLGRMDPTDARNNLSLEVLRWAKDSDAKVVVIENVPPFLRSPQWALLTRRLRRLGYGIETWELNAYDFGTPQLRRRAFTVASKVGVIGRPAETGPGKTAGQAISDLAGLDAGDDALHVWPEPRGVAAERIALVPPCGDKRDIIRLAPDLCPPSWIKMGCQATDVWGRMDPNAPANTLRCTFQNPSKGRYLHPTLNRTLSLREGARLQGIPDSWQMSGRGYPVARQIGNGVPVPLAAAVARQVAAALH
ncbi:DNA cytosine methyltransferase [Phenylobacterium sp. J426]|uniref:DNA cytosine methyltransferase n=1 Tax=Phenylobacterium sp. J426 TaxID=2898439 RepID=UPI00215166F8|nr:DNA cytosine methyltransferase [Phenylobacterium sp. J426]MCR5876591.1 DNA cytosine methyltransferase [Phenylobacterium sp. J426]